MVNEKEQNKRNMGWKKYMDKIKNKNLLFLLILMVFGLIFIPGYGGHLDQRSEQEILYSNYIAYCDGIHIKGNFYQNLINEGVISICDSIEKDHGMSVFYPMIWIHEVNARSPYIGNIIWHVYIYSFCFLGLTCFFYLIKDIFGSKTAFFSILIFFFTPRIFAEMHYNNKDMVFLALTMMIYAFGWWFYKKANIRNALLFGLVGAFAANMKIIGLPIWGLIGLFIFVSKIFDKTFDKKFLIRVFVAILSFVIIFFCITPASWGNVIDFLKYLFGSAQNFRWNDYLLFGGEHYCKSTTGMPRKYLPIIMLLTVPLGIWILAIVGGICIVYKLFFAKKKEIVSYLYLIVMGMGGFIPLCYAVLNATPVYNGWRHFYFVYASIMVFVAMGIHYVLKLWEKKKIGMTILGCYLLLLLIGIAINHPYQYTYYNFLAGNHVESMYELDYWDMSFKQALENIAREDDRQTILVTACDNPSKWGIEAQMFAIRGKYRCRFDTNCSFEEADYVIVNPTYMELYSQQYYDMICEEFILYDTIKSYGKKICYVYQRK